MKIGRFTIEQLSEGQFEFHKGGHYRRLESDSPDPSPPGGSIRRGTTILGIGPVLVQSEEYRLLLDTGLGWGMDAGSHYGDISNVKTNLEIFDLQPGDITDVILSHLHYDHAAGSTYVDAASRTSPTFPNATYHLHREEWKFALSHVESGDSPPIGSEYHLDEIYRLAADNRMNLIESDHLEILPGVDIVKTGGHTPGHLAVTISDNGKHAYYLGDLLPTEEHLNSYRMQSRDHHPVQAKKMKIRLMRKACDQNAILLFYHSLFSKVGRLEKDEDKKYVLKEL